MRDILSKVMTGSIVAGAALLVAACGGGNAANNMATDANTLDTGVYPADNGALPLDNGMMDNAGTDANLGMPSNMGGMDNGMANTGSANSQ